MNNQIQSTIFSELAEKCAIQYSEFLSAQKNQKDHFFMPPLAAPAMAQHLRLKNKKLTILIPGACWQPLWPNRLPNSPKLYRSKSTFMNINRCYEPV